MMYVSTACIKHATIKESVEALAQSGFKNIELSGGTKYYPEYKQDLLKLKDRYGLNYLLHSYFPPPQEDFILNLASLNEDVYQKTMAHYKRALALSRELGADKFGLHAGFFIDFSMQEIGKGISLAKLYDQGKAMKRFCEGFNHLKAEAKGIALYVENNVLSSQNTKNFGAQRPFMLTVYEEYVELKRMLDFHLLLDVAHLHVSSRSLGLDFAMQLKNLLPLTDYVHLSDNDGLKDEGRCFNQGSAILNALKGYDLNQKVITSETIGSLGDIQSSQALMARTLHL